MARRRSVGGIEIDVALQTAKVTQAIQKLNVDVNSGFGRLANSLASKVIVANQALGLLNQGMSMVGGAVSSLAAIVERGEAFHDLHQAFLNLYGSSTALGTDGLRSLREALQETVSDMDILTVANRAAQSELKPERFLEVARAAKSLADIVDGDTSQAFNDLSSAAETGNTKVLKKYGILIDVTKAEKDYAATLGVTADRLNEAGKLEARQLAMLEQYRVKAAAAGGSVRTVGQAVKEMSIAWDNSQTAFANAINQSNLLVTALDAVTVAARTVTGTVNLLFGQGVAGVDAQIAWTRTQLDSLSTVPDWWPTKDGERKELAEKLVSLLRQRAGLAAVISTETAKVETSESNITNHLTDNTAEITKQREELEKLGVTWRDNLRELEADVVKDSLQISIDRGDMAGFEEALGRFKDLTAAALQDSVAEAVSKGILRPEVAESYKDLMVSRAVMPWTEKRLDVEKKANKELAENWEKEHDDAVATWRSMFQNQLSGETWDMKDALSRLGVGFGAELGAQVSKGVVKGVKSVEDIGGVLWRWVGDAIADQTGWVVGQGRRVSGPPTREGIYPVEPGTEGGGTDYVSAGIVATSSLVSALNMEERNRQTGSAAGYGGAAGTAVGGTIGAIFGGPMGAMLGASAGQMVGDLVGGLIHSGHNPETQARHAFAGYIENTLREFTTLAFRDVTGNLQTLRGETFDFDTGMSGVFRDRPNWHEDMLGWGEEAFEVFSGLGQALKDVAGISEDVGGEIAYLLGENLAGNVDNARMMVQLLGVDFETLAGKIEEAAMRGEIRWAEYNVQIRGLENAFEPGLVAVGAYDQAMQNLIASGGRGMEAVVDFKNIAIEAMEAGVTTIEELEQRLLDAGVKPEVVDALINSVRARGITTLQEWAEASNATAGSIVGDMEAVSAGLAEQWRKLGEGIDKLNRKLEEVSKDVTAHVQVVVDGDLDELNDVLEAQNSGVVTGGVSGGGVEKPHAAGAIYKNAQRILIAETGIPEAILPLRTVNGRLGVEASMPETPTVGGGIAVYIDAKGAQRGVYGEVEAAVSAMESRIKSAARGVIDGKRRGYW